MITCKMNISTFQDGQFCFVRNNKCVLQIDCTKRLVDCIYFKYTVGFIVSNERMGLYESDFKLLNLSHDTTNILY